MNAITIATFNELKDAEPVRKRLEEAGIHTQIEDESTKQKFLYLSSEHLASVRILVDEKDFEAAKKHLVEWSVQEHLLDKEVRCPQCHSPAVQFPQMTRKFVTTSLHSILFKLHLVEKQFYCQNCHHMWPIAEKLEPKRDDLGWPIKEEPSHTADASGKKRT